MADYIPVINVAEVTQIHTLDGQQVLNTQYFLKSSAWTTEELQSLADEAEADWATFMVPDFVSALTYNGCKVVDLTTQSSGTAEHSASVAGGVTGQEPLPNSVALCMSFRTASRGRSFRGRNYLCGYSYNRLNGANVWNATFVADTTSHMISYLEAVQTAIVVDHVIVSRFHNKAPRVTGIATPVTQVFATNDNVDSQRRRLRGRGK